MKQAIAMKQSDNGEYCLSGELDRDTVPPFWRARANWLPKEKAVTLDLSALQRVDSAGLALLLHLQQYLKMNEQVLTIQNIPPQLHVLMTLSNVAEFFKDVTSSVDGE